VPTTSNKPLRFGKGSGYEGGTRVPLIVHWPGVTKAGSVEHTPVISMDLFPTILEMDGVSLVSLPRQRGKLGRDTLFWHYPHYRPLRQTQEKSGGIDRKGFMKMEPFQKISKIAC
jgi:arylsulfatase A